MTQNTDAAVVKKIVDETMTNGIAYTNLEKLCKQVGPRLSGTANHFKAVRLTEAMLKDIGVDTVYLQPCMVPHWVRGNKEQGEILFTGGKKFQLHLTALGNSVGTVAAGISASVLEVENMSELASLGESVIKGKIVFFNFKMNPTYIETFRAYGESGLSRVQGLRWRRNMALSELSFGRLQVILMIILIPVLQCTMILFPKYQL